MKILWVEDFGPPLSRSEIIEEIFAEFFTGLDLGREYHEDEGDTNAQLARLFAQHTLHEIYICESYVEWKRVDSEHAGDFDLVLIDIRLNSSVTPAKERPKGLDSPDFDEKAGFYIYNQLIRRGFPDDHIAFFTAEGQSLKHFGEYCGSIMQDRPAQCFQKTPAHYKRVRQWLLDKASQPSLILRRGVLDGCRTIKRKIEKMDDLEIKSQLIFYKTVPGRLNDGPETLRRDSLEYLDRLERVLVPARYNESPNAARSFVLELAGKWEESLGVFPRAKRAPQFESWLDNQFYRSAYLQLKTLRNWSSHRQLSSTLTERELAYFFLLAMRAFVKTELDVVFEYERILSTLFDVISESELHRQINASFEFRLEDSYGRLKSLHVYAMRNIDESFKEKLRPASYERKLENYFLAMLQETGEAAKWMRSDSRNMYVTKIREESIDLFYSSFWHGLFPMEIKSFYYGNLEKVKFYIEPLPSSFISLLGRSIFHECFKETEATV